jgi:hypothetical protein
VTVSCPADKDGFICPELEFHLDAFRIGEYAEAVGDPNPLFRRRGRDHSHVVAPPAMASAYIQEPVRELFRRPELAERLGVPVERIVVGEIEYRYHRLVRPGEWLRVGGRLRHREAKGDKEVLVFETEARDDAGNVVTSAEITIIRR